MHTLLRVFTLGFAALFLHGCATIEDYLPAARYTMTEQQVLPLDQRLSITYEGAQDSRCPSDARCIWRGQLAYRFTMRVGNVAQGFYLVPGQPGYMSPALRGARIELDHMTPLPPAPRVGTTPLSYPVAINVYPQ